MLKELSPVAQENTDVWQKHHLHVCVVFLVKYNAKSSQGFYKFFYDLEK